MSQTNTNGGLNHGHLVNTFLLGLCLFLACITVEEKFVKQTLRISVVYLFFCLHVHVYSHFSYSV